MSRIKKNPSFDELAAKYDLWSKVPLGKLCSKIENEAFFKVYGPIKNSGPVLDIGCGTGNHVVYLAGRGLNVTGIDLSKKMLGIALQKVLKNNIKTANLIHADAKNLPFEDNSFKTVICSLALEFTDNPQEIVHEAYRVLQPSGQLVLAFLNSWSPLNITRKFKGFFKPSIYNRANFMSRRYVNYLLKNEGFNDLMWDRAICFPLIDKYFFINTFYNRFEKIGKIILPGFSAYIVVKGYKE